MDNINRATQQMKKRIKSECLVWLNQYLRIKWRSQGYLPDLPPSSWVKTENLSPLKCKFVLFCFLIRKWSRSVKNTVTSAASDLTAWPCGPTSRWPGHPLTSTLPSCHGTSRPLRASALRAIIGSVSPVWLMRFKSCPRPGLSPDGVLQVSIAVSPQRLGQPCPEHGGTSWERTRQGGTRRGEARVNFSACHYEKSQVSLRYEKKMGVLMRGLEMTLRDRGCALLTDISLF